MVRNGKPQIINDVDELKENYTEVSAKLDKTNESLENKANLNSVFSMANMGQDIKTAMTGGSVAVVGENAILRENIIDKQIDDSKFTDSYVCSKNLFNKDTVIYGKFVNQTNGKLADNSDFFASQKIYVEKSCKYIFKYGTQARYAIYKSDGTFIKGAVGSNSITTTEDTSYIKISDYISNLENMQLEKGNLSTSKEDYKYGLKNLIIDKENIGFTIDTIELPIINLPNEIISLEGEELNIYFDNVVENSTLYDFDVTCNTGVQLERCFRVEAGVVGDYQFTLDVLKNNIILTSKSCTIKTISKSSNNGVSKKVIIMGDSTTDAGTVITKLNENFSTDTMNVISLGTRGQEGAKHEGRNGWTLRQYLEVQTDGICNNAFYNPSTTNFDFKYYLSNNSIETPDYFIINLGINDMFSFTNDNDLEGGIALNIIRLNLIINSIKQVDGVKVCIALTIPPCISQTAFGYAYKNGQTRSKYKRNNIKWVNRLIQEFDNRKSEGIYLIPINVNIDTKYNFENYEVLSNKRTTKKEISYPGISSVHPITSGYWQIADMYWFFLKGIS